MRQVLCNDTVSVSPPNCLSILSCVAAAAYGEFAAVGRAGGRYRSTVTGAGRSAANASSDVFITATGG